MFPVHIFHSMLRGVQSKQNQTLSLAPGQVIRGEVLKLYNEGHSLVRLGSFHVLAKLEASLAVGEKSWFQVQSSMQPVILKMISAPSLPLAQDQNDLSQLLRFFGLKSTAASEKLTQFFLAENLPMTRQSLRTGVEIIEQLGAKSETLAAMRFAVQKGLPLTPQVVQSVQAFKFAPDLVTQIKGLEDHLPPATKTELQGLIARLAEDMASKPNGLQLFLQRLGVKLESSLAKEASVPSSAGVAHGTELGNSRFTGKSEILSSVSAPQVDQGRMVGVQQGTQSGNPLSSQAGRELQNQQQNRLLDGSGGLLKGDHHVRSTSQTPPQSSFARQVESHEQVNRILNSSARGLEQVNAPPNNHGALGTHGTQGEHAIREQQEVDPLNREGNFLKGNPQTAKGNSFAEITSAQQQQQVVEQQVLSLKTFLSQLLQSEALSKQSKDKVQILLQTIQGQQVIFAAEAQQPFQTHAFQAFYPFGADLCAVYGQFSGKKNEDGQIDPENCRMLFHLDLPQLGETDIDVSIQAGYVAITFYSLNLPLNGQAWLKENEASVKEALLGLGYTLTTMQWREVEQGNKRIPPKDVTQSYVQIPVQGVDIRL